METLEEVLHKEMTRQEFLATIGFAAASLFGLSTILHFLFGKHTSGNTGMKVDMGYGGNVYGGR
jgi:hypothetical protein